jgi:putative inorganic carbon (HCO3(-)) transporter
MAVPARLEVPAHVEPSRPGLLIPATVLVGLVAVASAFLLLQRPEAVLLAFVVAVVVVVCALRVDFAVLLLVATAPLEGAIELGAGNELTISKLAGALCFGAFFLFALATRRRLILDRSHAIVVVILALALLSTLQAENIGQGLSTTIRYGSFAAMYIIVSQFVGDHRLQRRVAWVLSIASTLTGILMIQNFVSGESLQASVPYTNPNDSAFILATTLPLTFWLLRDRWAYRLAAIAMIGVISGAIVLSFSRGAVVGLAVAALWHLFTERRHAFVLALGVVAAVIATFAFVQRNPEQVEAGFQAKQQIAEYNVNTRIEAWAGALELVQEDPLLGVGPGNFRERYFEVTDRPPGTQNLLVVHNAYLDVGAELGVLAMLLFVAYVGMVLWRSTVARRIGSGLPGYATAVRSGLIVAAVSSLFLSEQYYAPLWLLGALATALWRESRGGAVPQRP